MNDPIKIEIIPVHHLNEYQFNSRTHSEEQLEQIANSIIEFGFTNPVLIDNNNQIIAGHGRWMAAKRIGILEVPCIRLGLLTDTQRRAYVIADNKLAENAGWETAILRLELQDLNLENFDLSLLGFDESEIEDLLSEPSGSNDGSDSGDDKEYTLTITTKDEAEVMALRNIFGIGKKASSVDASKVFTAIHG